MAQKIDAKFEGKRTCAFKNGMKNLANFTLQAEKWEFILESKIVNLIKRKIQNNQIDQMQCENVILPWK